LPSPTDIKNTLKSIPAEQPSNVLLNNDGLDLQSSIHLVLVRAAHPRLRLDGPLFESSVLNPLGPHANKTLYQHHFSPSLERVFVHDPASKICLYVNCSLPQHNPAFANAARNAIFYVFAPRAQKHVGERAVVSTQ